MSDSDRAIITSTNSSVNFVQPTQSIKALQSLDQLIVDGQPQFGVFAHVKHLNYLDYHSYLISQKPVSKRRKQLKVNQFAFIQLSHGCNRIGMAIATVKLATTAFVYIYNDLTEQFEVVEAMQPLTRKSEFTGDHRHGEMTFENDLLSIRLDFSPQRVIVNVNSDLFKVTAKLQRGDSPLAVCSPSGRRGWTFTQKEPFVNVAGELVLYKSSKHFSIAKNSETKDLKAKNTNFNKKVLVDENNSEHSETKHKIAFNTKTVASLDWTLGFMRHETNWFWCSINNYLKNQSNSNDVNNDVNNDWHRVDLANDPNSPKQHFMLNLSMGVNETGVSENACWLDGKIYYLPPVMFRRKTGKLGSPAIWTITNQNLGWSLIDIELSFTPIEVYKKSDNYGILASIFEQCIGLYSGYIKIGDEKIIIDQVMGLAEDHFAKW